MGFKQSARHIQLLVAEFRNLEPRTTKKIQVDRQSMERSSSHIWKKNYSKTNFGASFQFFLYYRKYYVRATYKLLLSQPCYKIISNPLSLSRVQLEVCWSFCESSWSAHVGRPSCLRVSTDIIFWMIQDSVSIVNGLSVRLRRMMKMDVVECKFLVKSRQSQLPV